MVNLETVFQGKLRLKPMDQVPVEEVRKAYERVTGQRCEAVFLLPASSARDALPILQEHHPEVSIGEVLNQLFSGELSSLFHDADQLAWYKHTFELLFEPASTNSIQHAFRDFRGWCETGDPRAEQTFKAVRRSFFTAHYYSFGLQRVTLHDKTTVNHSHDLEELATLMRESVIPFALSDDRHTLLCLAA